MWIYEKKLPIPVRIRKPNARLAQEIVRTVEDANAEGGAAFFYLAGRLFLPRRECSLAFTEIGTEELTHVEILSNMICQLTGPLSDSEIELNGLDVFMDADQNGIWLSGMKASPDALVWLDDPMASLQKAIELERRASHAFEELLRHTDDPDVIQPLSYLLEREQLHLQRLSSLLERANIRSDCTVPGDLVGASEEIEYVRDETTNCVSCRRTGNLIYHD